MIKLWKCKIRNPFEWIRNILETLQDLSLGHAQHLQERELDSIVQVIVDQNLNAKSIQAMYADEYEEILGITCMFLQEDLFAMTHPPLPDALPSIAMNARHATAVPGSPPIRMLRRARQLLALTDLPK